MRGSFPRIPARCVLVESHERRRGERTWGLLRWRDQAIDIARRSLREGISTR